MKRRSAYIWNWRGRPPGSTARRGGSVSARRITSPRATERCILPGAGESGEGREYGVSGAKRIEGRRTGAGPFLLSSWLALRLLLHRYVIGIRHLVPRLGGAFGLAYADRLLGFPFESLIAVGLRRVRARTGGNRRALSFVPPDHAFGAIHAEHIEEVMQGGGLIAIETALLLSHGHHGVIGRDHVLLFGRGHERAVHHSPGLDDPD